MSKYSKLPDTTIKIKLEKMISDSLSKELVERIKFALDPFDRSLAEPLCIEVEIKLAEIKKITDELKKVEAARLAAEKAAEVKEEDEEDLTKEEKKEFTPIITKNEWTELKNSMGVPLLSEDDTPMFHDLKTQFLSTYKRLKVNLIKARYYDKSKFSEDWKFKFVNLNNGFAKEFELFKDYLYTCFRLSVDPETQECIYESWWIVNSSDGMDTILGSDYEYFEWTEISDLDKFLLEFMKSNDPKYIAESYIL